MKDAAVAELAVPPAGDGVAAVVLIGDPADPHIDVVARRLPRQGTVVIDAASLPTVLEGMSLHGCTVRDLAGEVVRLAPQIPSRGWIRRLAPADWERDVVLGSKRAAGLASRMTALAAVVRQAGTTWLCDVDALFAAENKIVQYRAADALGLRVPRTMIGGDPDRLAAELGEPFVIKPLGPGNFTADDGGEQVIHTRAVTAAQLAGADLLDAPFLAQQLLSARFHLRVVTVTDRVWTAELDAGGLPVDWRSVDEAHHSFTPSSRWPGVGEDAVRLARCLGTGISCQDWIIDECGPAFVDLNPGGQWLFLPEVLTLQIADHLAAWLNGA